MDTFDGVDAETLLTGTSDWLTADVAETLTEQPLECVETEFPHVVYSVESSDPTIQPSEDHPVFYGCFDWHSAVHSHWNLIRQLRLLEDHPNEAEIVDSIDRRFTPDNVAEEVGYLDENPTFEKPYGWAWVLRLAAELSLWDCDRADNWRDVLQPLEDTIVSLVESEFLTQDRPFRVGTHNNSAFALTAVLDYARVVSNDTLEATTLDTSNELFGDDTDAPLEYEPIGWDFLSPSLAEADLMRRVLGRVEFAEWIDAFLPDVTESPYDSILHPVEVDTDTDEDIALHLVGLNLSRAWCLAGIADSLPDHRFVDSFEEGARRHIEYSLDQAFTEKYAGTHWLSSFVLYLTTRKAGGIAPGVA
jgi:hypothetical protein